MRRHRMGHGASRSHFSKHASRTHGRNIAKNRPVMRGGIRM